MENLKIRVNSKAESKEAQELFFELGYKWFSGGNQVQHLKQSCSSSFGYLVAWCSGCFTDVIQCGCGNEDAKEITLPELRDLVVLKRNDVGDATHTDPNEKESLYFRLFGDWWNLFTGGEWQQFCHMDSPRAAKLKPIEKPMKEYLRKNGDGTYSYIGMVQPENISQNVIEVPKWAVAYADHKNGHGFFYDSFCKIASFYNIVWYRHTHPEELPFIDDEPQIETATGYQLDIVGSNTYGARSRDTGESDIYYRQYLMNFIVGNRTKSLNDQYAEIEKVRQSAWQKQEGGSHYKNLKIQPMQYALENKLDYAQANVVKYVTRHKEKNGKEDLLKAIHNLELMIEFYYGDEK